MKKKVAAGVLTLALVFTIGGTLAYMASNEEAGNTFTIGSVHIKTTETEYPATDEDGDGVPETPKTDENKNGIPDDNESLVPYEEEPKNPVIHNTGINDAIVFMKVTVPAEEIIEIDDNGNRKDKTESDIFWFKMNSDDKDTAHANNYDKANWVELTDFSGNLVDNADCNKEGRGREYLFAYKTKVAPGDQTTALFEKIQNKKYGSTTIRPDEIESITIDSYAIQADSLYRNGQLIDTSGTVSDDDLAYIYQVYFNQNSTIEK